VVRDKVIEDWIDAALAGNTRAVARLLTQAESDASMAQAIVRAIYPHTGQAHLVGVTGPPGSGKSSLVNELAKTFRRRARRVGIVAVDPSSPFTGGAILGDRVRMRDLSGDEGIFVRSMASRGSLGGLARATAAVVKVLDAVAYDIILIETVGAGQAEVDIAATAHTTIVLEAPGMGDDIQSIKAGILEIADILVVNKADQPGANRVVKSLEMMLHLGIPSMPAGDSDVSHHHHDGGHATREAPVIGSPTARWAVPVLQTVATSGAGVEELAAAIEAHYAHLRATGEWARRELARTRSEMDRLVRDRFVDLLTSAVPAEEREALITAVVERRIDPYAAAEKLFNDAAAMLAA
jgi:LAO/AO transport system kinase